MRKAPSTFATGGATSGERTTKKRRKARGVYALSIRERKDFINAAALESMRDQGLTYLAAAHKVAIQQELVHIQAGEEAAVKMAVYREIKRLKDESADTELRREEAVQDAVEEARRQEAEKENRQPLKDAALRSQNRKGVCGRKRKALGDALVNTATMYKGAADHRTYREAA